MVYKNKQKYFRYQISSQTTDIGFYSCLDKSVTNSLLEAAQINVPQGFYIARSDPKSYWIDVFQALTKPLVVKPTHGNQGSSVSMDVRDQKSYEWAVEKAFNFLNDPEAGVIVEEFFPGKEYRILATREKIIGVVLRIPANVQGDGVSTIQELIEKKNQDPRRGESPNYLIVAKIKVDETVLNHLANQKMTLQTVPMSNQVVFLRLNSNISTGGDSIDVTEITHPTVNEVVLKAVRAIPGLDFAGVDFITNDITQPITEKSYAIIEVNSSPGFSLHDYPYEGKNRHAAYEFLCILFPELRQDFPEPL